MQSGVINVEVVDHEIDRAHRVGSRSEGKTRAIIVKLSSHRSKIKILKNKKVLKDKRGFYINEDLTRLNQKLLFDAREALDVNVGSVYSYDGKILAKRRSDNKIVRVKSKDDLKTLFV